MNRCFIQFLIIPLFMITMTGCSDVSQKEKDAVNAFGHILDLLSVEQEDGWFQMTSPDGGAKFVFSNSDMGLAIDAAPFIAAGMDVLKLENVNDSVFYKMDMGFSLPGWDMLNQNIKNTALDQFKANVKYFGKYLTYDNNTNRYAINFDNAIFEWTKDMVQKESRIVFSFDAKPLVAAGVKPDQVEGWSYVEVSTFDNGNAQRLWYFQKTIDLKSF